MFLDGGRSGSAHAAGFYSAPTDEVRRAEPGARAVRSVAMKSVRKNIAEHGRIASASLFPDCIIGMTHVDGHRYSFALADLCEHGEIVAVQLIGRGEEGILVTFDDGHEHRLYFATQAQRSDVPSMIPALSEQRVRELAL